MHRLSPAGWRGTAQDRRLPLRAVAAIAGAGIVAVLATGCASRAPHTPRGTVRFRDIEYYALVSDAGSAAAFTAFATDTRDVRVQPSSAARVDTVRATTPRLVTAAERDRWRAAGQPALPKGAAAGRVLSMPAGTFTFMPQGRVLTYQQATSFPEAPSAVLAEIVAHLKPYAGVDPPAPLVARQLGFVLATAPLGHAARTAMWTALLSIRGLHPCGTGTDLAGRAGQWVCVSSRQDEARVLVDVAQHGVLAVADRLLAPSQLYPGVADGSLIGEDTFMLES